MEYRDILDISKGKSEGTAISPPYYIKKDKYNCTEKSLYTISERIDMSKK